MPKFKTLTRLMVLPLLALSIGFVGCSDNNGGGEEGFEATLTDFQDFHGWTRVDYTIYPTAEDALGAAHAGNDPGVARRIYRNDAAAMSGQDYRAGSIYVKETFSWANDAKQPVNGGAFLAIAKRGADFDPDGNDWEYFDLGADGNQIAGRGAELMNGACKSCHSSYATYNGADFIFPHPAEYEIPQGNELDVFSNPTSWEMIDSTTGDDPLLGPAHGGGDLYRVVYRWQPAARYDGGQFPVGTVLLKEVYELDGDNNKTNVTWTAMVKRGGVFNSANGNWEWFMVADPYGNPMVNRGSDLMDNACNSCHSQAPTSGGGDYVFNHPGLGF